MLYLCWAACPLVAQTPVETNPPENSSVFWWGVSTSAYQNEDPAVAPGDPFYFRTDWDLFIRAHLLQPKGNASYSYTRFDRDLAALQQLGVNAYRFGIEWARIEPQPGVYNEAAIVHYVQMAKSLRQAGIEPVVCLWHFTFPDWVSDLKNSRKHGWLHPMTPQRWSAYVRLMVERFGADVTCYAPQNEPNAQCSLGYLAGLFSPGAFLDVIGYDQSTTAAAEAFIAAAKIIKEIKPDAKIISIESAQYYERSPLDFFGLFFAFSQGVNFEHLDRIAPVVDEVGINYYFTEIALPESFFDARRRQGRGVSELGWPINPSSLYRQIKAFSERYGKPVLVMENGVATLDEEQRVSYLASHIEEVERAQADGYDVRGYFYWTLVDNWEWTSGYFAHFGLMEPSADWQTLSPRPAAVLYTNLIRP